jgi:hypothetical protein
VTAKILAFSFVLLFSVASAQTDSVYTGTQKPRARPKEKTSFLKDKMIYGGNFQAWIGNPTFVFLSPTIGFQPHKTVQFGVGGIYNYRSVSDGSSRFSESVFGGHSFVRYIIADRYYLQMQYDRLNQRNYIGIDPTARTWVDYLLAGAGLKQPVGEKASMLFSVMYNLTPSLLSIYYPNRLVVQFGFIVGF